MTTATDSMLDHAAARSLEAAKTARAQEVEVIAAMRQEIGPHHYDEAKRQVPILEQAITQRFLPFLQRLAALLATAPPFRDDMRLSVANMNLVCESAVRQVLGGIQAYEGLTLKPLLWTDGRSIDVNLRTARMAWIRSELFSHNGKIEFLANQQAIIARYIEDSGWPAVPTVRD